jgi:hypothetical protein
MFKKNFPSFLSPHLMMGGYPYRQRRFLDLDGHRRC